MFFFTKKYLFIIFLIISRLSFSQGLYIDNEDKAVGFGPSVIITSDEDLIYSVGIGYTFYQKVDIFGSYAFAEDINIFTAGIQYNFLTKIVNISPAIGISHTSFLEKNIWIPLNAYLLGLTASKKIKVKDYFSVMPMFSVSYFIFQENDFIKLKEKTDLSYSLSIPLIFKTKRNYYFALEPSILSFDDEPVTSIGLMVIF